MGCRRLSACEEAAASILKSTGTEAEALHLDLASFASVKGFSEKVRQKHDMIDSLILNAGVAYLPFGLTEDGIEKHMGK